MTMCDIYSKGSHGNVYLVNNKKQNRKDSTINLARIAGGSTASWRSAASLLVLLLVLIFMLMKNKNEVVQSRLEKRWRSNAAGDYDRPCRPYTTM